MIHPVASAERAGVVPLMDDPICAGGGDQRRQRDDDPEPSYEAHTALPYPHTDRAAAGLRAQLRHRLGRGETPDWATFTVTGSVATSDARGRTWYEYRAELT